MNYQLLFIFLKFNIVILQTVLPSIKIYKKEPMFD